MRDTILVHNCDDVQFMMTFSNDGIKEVTESPYFFSVILKGKWGKKEIIKHDMTGEEILNFRHYCDEFNIKIKEVIHPRDRIYARREEV